MSKFCAGFLERINYFSFDLCVCSEFAGLFQGHCAPLKPLTALSIGNQAAKVKTTMLVSTSDFIIISFQKKTLISNAI